MNGIELIAAERTRQVTAEGFNAQHDDEHDADSLSMAAACYAAPTAIRRADNGMDPWPWEAEWDKRKTHSRIRQLTIAGALIAAEIDRLQRVRKG